MQQPYPFPPPEQPSVVPGSAGSSATSAMFARSMSGPRGADVSFSASQNGLSGAPNDSQSMASNSFSAPEMFMKPMNQWMTEEPWNHITGRKDALAHVNNFRIGNTRPHVPAFSYQASIAPSECETTGFRPLPSDSGYESVDRTHHGFPSGSTYGDRQIETASVLSSHIEHQFDRPAIPGWSVRPGVIQSTQANNPVEGNALICQFCNEKVKTKSEIKKHKQRHEKPHHCDVPGCPRTEGFSTTNDVDRHKKSCHPEHVPNAKFYRCTVQGCRYPNKKWPRPDNFKQHLKRVHDITLGENDLEQYTYKSPGLSIATELVGLGTAIEDSLPARDGNTLSPSWYNFEVMHGHLMGGFQNDEINEQQVFDTMHPSQIPTSVSNTTLEISPTQPVAKPEELQMQDLQSEWQNSESFSQKTDNDQHSRVLQLLGANSTSHDNPPESDLCSTFYGEIDQIMPDQLDVNAENIDSEQASRDSSIDLEQADVPSPNDILNDAPPLTEVVDLSSSTFPETTSLGDSPGVGSTEATSQIRDEQVEMPRTVIDTSDFINDDDKALVFIKALNEKGMLKGLLEKSGYQIPQSTGSEATTTPSVQSITNENIFYCEEDRCNKAFVRRCELKKHEKRHVKPYACTFDFCDKRFGSKNDWKRHENSQHYQLELWKCNERNHSNTNGDMCGKTCHRREQFRAHLTKDHQITTPADLEQKLEQCLVGQNCDSKFWCGFCHAVISVEERGLKAWASRFNHIDEHFSGRGRPKVDISQWKSHSSAHPGMNPPLTAESTDVQSVGSSSTPSLEPRRTSKASKRAASDDAQHQPSRKKGARVFYCCGCDSQLPELTLTCLTPGCFNHQRCDSCTGDTFRLFIS